MYCVRNVTDDLIWVGGNDRKLSLFESVYPVPKGISYNSYLLKDEKTILFDTADKSISSLYIDNVEYALAGRKLDYIVIHHMEPDHSATLRDVVLKYPDAKIICSSKAADMIRQFFDFEIDSRLNIVKEGGKFSAGKHNFVFFMAPMVHWPEVMVSYDETDKMLFSADAFGCFGALNGALFADEVDFFADYMNEARRYFTNIVGKYGAQVQSLLKKAANLDIKMICPLHGFVWRKDLEKFIEKYDLWSRYEPEEKAVMIAYSSVYGNTENAADILSSRLREKGIKTVMYDVSLTHHSEIIASAFRYSHFVFASPTYNAGIFITMENLLMDIANHNIQNRSVAFIENGSWAATSAKQMRAILEKCKNLTFIENKVTLKSSVKKAQLDEIYALADALENSMK